MRTRFTLAQNGGALWLECNRVVAFYEKTSGGLRSTMLLLEGGHEVWVSEREEKVRGKLDGTIL